MWTAGFSHFTEDEKEFYGPNGGPIPAIAPNIQPDTYPLHNLGKLLHKLPRHLST